jgi:glutamyl-tRNA reductase
LQVNESTCFKDRVDGCHKLGIPGVDVTGAAQWKLVKRSLEATGHLVVLGINYHSSPIAIRERFVIPAYCMSHALHALARFPHVKEAVVLSTCNRTEVYAVVTDVQAGLAEIESFYLSTQAISDHGALKPNFKLLRDDVALHLFRVASGLDSMVLGEGQIMSQVKGALKSAQDAGTIGPVLEQIFQLALNCGKRVRTETEMARRAVSVSSAAIELARDVLGSLKEKSILLVGAGKMGKICAKHLLSEGGNGSLVLVNRTADRVVQFADQRLPNVHKLKTSFNYQERYELTAGADVVIVSTSAPDFVFTAEQLRQIKRDRNCLIIDISVPRNVDPEIGTIPGITLFHSDDLAQIVNKNLAERESLVAEAERLVFETLGDFHGWQRSLLVVPTITGLRKKIESIRDEQIRKTVRNRQSAGDCGDHSAQQQDIAEAEQISRAIVNQILHHPTIQLKATADYEMLRRQAEALQTLFDLDILSVDDRQPPVTVSDTTVNAYAKHTTRPYIH